MTPVIVSVVGTRPNLVKLFSLASALKGAAVRHVIVHTGQHFDRSMNDPFFRDLELPAPDHHLGVGEGSASRQTAMILERLPPLFKELQPAWVVVYGDVTSTLAASLAARQNGRRLAHVEAGYRSHDRSMPEEVNRRLIDHAADLCLAADRVAAGNLEREGFAPERWRLVGSTNLDALAHLTRSPSPPPAGLPREYAFLTLHRPANVDQPETLRRLMAVLGELSAELPIVFPVHPRTRRRLEEIAFAAPASLVMREPLGYADCLAAVRGARVVLSDSGGLQEECAYLGAPLILLRANTERPQLVESGHARLVGASPEAVRAAWRASLAASPPPPYRDELTDGRTGERISRLLLAT